MSYSYIEQLTQVLIEGLLSLGVTDLLDYDMWPWNSQSCPWHSGDLNI